LILIVVDEANAGKAVSIIKDTAHTGNFGDGKIFISPVDAAYTVRTGEAGL
jgi:nitrogen regulatory protein PII 1